MHRQTANSSSKGSLHHIVTGSKLCMMTMCVCKCRGAASHPKVLRPHPPLPPCHLPP